MAKKCGSPNKFLGSFDPTSFASVGNAISQAQTPSTTSFRYATNGKPRFSKR